MIRRTGLAVIALAVGALSMAVAAPAHAAPKEGKKCKKAGIVVHVGNIDLRCTKNGKYLVWAKVMGGSGSGGGQQASDSGMGIATNASIPKTIQNWGLDLAPYDASTGKAGVMQLAGVQPPTFPNPADTDAYSRIVGLYGASVQGILEPQMAFIAPLGTPVIAMSDGTVCDMPVLYSNDYSIRVAPKGFACSSGAASVLFEHEHVLNPLVKVGDTVKAGQQIATVSDYNGNWKSKGMGMVETGVFFMKNDNSGKPWHACLANYLDPSKSASLKATLTSIENGWMSVRGDTNLYNLGAQNPVGCLTQDDITDSNSGVK